MDQSRGEGAMLVGTWGTFVGNYVPTALIRDSKFLRNQAAYGGAISIRGSEADVVVERCFFEVGASDVDRDTVGSTPTT